LRIVAIHFDFPRGVRQRKRSKVGLVCWYLIVISFLFILFFLLHTSISDSCERFQRLERLDLRILARLLYCTALHDCFFASNPTLIQKQTDGLNSPSLPNLYRLYPIICLPNTISSSFPKLKRYNGTDRPPPTKNRALPPRTALHPRSQPSQHLRLRSTICGWRIHIFSLL